MDERISKLKNLQTNSLIDVVKNYKKYDYPIEIKNEALIILEERGIVINTLEITGKLKNKPYDKAISEFNKYNINSIIGLGLYILSIYFFSNFFLLSVIIYLIALIFIGFSLNNINKIAKILNDESINYPSWFVIFILIICLFLYFFVFFFNRRQLKEKIFLKT